MLGSFFRAACKGKSVNSEPKNQNFHTVTLQKLTNTKFYNFNRKIFLDDHTLNSRFY